MRRFCLQFLTSFTIASVLLSGCTEDFLQTGTGDGECEVEFSIKVSEPTAEGATFLITNSGKDRNTWYGFAYDDVSTPVQAAINRKVRELSALDGGVSGVLERGSKRIRIEDGLSPATKYIYVVFGLTAEGTVYGKPVSCEFKTEHSDMKFGLEISGETSSSVEISVTPSGEGEWYAFVTEDLTGDATELLRTKVAALEDIPSVLNSGKKSVKFGDLPASKKLRAIVSGLDADGTVFGTPSILEFRLTPDATLNENWAVTYDGYVKPQGADKSYRKITNTSTDNGRYFIDVISEENLTKLYNNDINAYVKAAVANLLVKYPSNWNKYVFTGTSSIYYTLRTRKSYFAVAIGIDRNGFFTGSFAISEKFRIDGKDWSAIYDKWLGRWEATDNTGHGYSLTISEDKREDFTFLISGWNKVTDTPMHGVIDDETGKLYITAYNYGQHDLVTDKGTIKVTKMLVGLTSKGFYGIADDNSDVYYICACDLDNDGSNATMKGLSISTTSGTLSFTQMFYIGVNGSSVYTYGDRSTFPTFPIKMGRAGL